jgi:cytochrome P450
MPEAARYEDYDVSVNPIPTLHGIRDRAGQIVQRIDGRLAGDPYPNNMDIDDSFPTFVVLGYDAWLKIVRDEANFVVGGAFGAHHEVEGHIVTFLDGAAHTRLRRLLQQAFGRGAIERLVPDLLNPISSWLVDRAAARLAEGEAVDVIRDLAVPMSYKVVSCMLGTPQEDFEWLVTRGTALFNAPWDIQGARVAHEELTAYYSGQLADRRRNPADDLITWLAQAELDDGSRLTDTEIVTHARFLLPAGIETTSRQLSLMVFTLLADPARYATVGKDPSLVGAAVDEVLRWAPVNASGGTARHAAHTVTVAGVEIPENSFLQAAPAIINRDPSRWDDPDVFNIHRPYRAPATFATGVHQCLGIHIAKTEMMLLLQKLIAKVPGLRLARSPGDIRIAGIPIQTPVEGVPVTL